MSSEGLKKIGLKSARFRDERLESWQALESLLSRTEGGRTGRLSDAELLELPRLYRAALSSLSVARATSLDQGVVRYLESLCERAYYTLYGVRMPLWKRFLGYLVHGWPSAVRTIWPELLVAFGITLLATLIGIGFVTSDPEWFYAFVDAGLAGERNPAASRETLESVIYTSEAEKEQGAFGVFAAYLFSHNSRVAILAFALGFAFGIPTMFLLIQNGLMLGAFIGLHMNKQLGFEIGGWLSVHGTTEIGAIILAGAGGLHIGRKVAFPGRKTRLASAAASGDVGARVLGGVVIMLFIAGLLEAYPRQLVDSDGLRYAIGWGLFVMWCAYFFIPRRSVPSEVSSG
ncbi:MAG: stage II sporulation protein M [Pseudomonadota bacterium]